MNDRWIPLGEEWLWVVRVPPPDEAVDELRGRGVVAGGAVFEVDAGRRSFADLGLALVLVLAAAPVLVRDPVDVVGLVAAVLGTGAVVVVEAAVAFDESLELPPQLASTRANSVAATSGPMT